MEIEILTYLWLYVSEIKEQTWLFWFFVLFCHFLFFVFFNSSSSPLGSWHFVAICLLVAEALWLWEPCCCAWGGVRISLSSTKPSLLTAALRRPGRAFFFLNVFFWGVSSQIHAFLKTWQGWWDFGISRARSHRSRKVFKSSRPESVFGQLQYEKSHSFLWGQEYSYGQGLVESPVRSNGIYWQRRTLMCQTLGSFSKIYSIGYLDIRLAFSF